jgi:hypothetical protein
VLSSQKEKLLLESQKPLETRRRLGAAALPPSKRRHVVTHSEKPLDFRYGYLPARPALPTSPTIKTVALAAALLAYAVGFAILYPLAQSSVSRSAAEGNDPALMNFVGP